ncbi:MAG TPA: hypothetical protein VFG20_13750 [Planctomycetaceae bacterium]|jgi:hypothetical protein|nr:hypothetical protein [Planctomycetaceae bacterium]
METVLEQNARPFVDRRANDPGGHSGPERRQFRATPNQERPEVAELANAIDQYKLDHRRRFITFEELHGVITRLGYHK